MLERFKNYISVIFQIFVRDIKRLIYNPIALIILLGVCVLPAIYAWYAIAAMWDPYNETGSMKVAVVSEDKGADSKYTGRINIGEEVIDELHSNHELDWQFVSKDKAMDGVYSSEYYAALIFPEDFSKDFISVFSGDFQKPQIEYYPNEKLSGSATKVTDSAANKLEKKINESFVSVVSKKIVDIAQDVGDDVEKDSDEANGSLTASVDEAKEAITQNVELIDGLDRTIGNAQGSIRSAQSSIDSLCEDIPELQGDLSNANATLLNIKSTLNEYSSKIGASVTKSSLAISQAATEASIAAGKISSSISQIQTNVDAAIEATQNLIADIDALLEELRNSPAASSSSVQAAITRIEQQNASLRSTLQSLQTLSKSLSETANEVSDATSVIAQEASDASTNIRDAAADFQTDILPSLDASLNSLSSAIGTLKGALGSLESMLSQDDALLDQLFVVLDDCKGICDNARRALTNIETDLTSTLTDLKALQNSASFHELDVLLGMSPDDVSSFMASPVTLKTITVYPVSSYGSGIAPFFSNLALWVCGFILMALVKIRVDPKGLPKFSPTQGYFGRWLLYMAVGIIQAIVICVGDIMIGIQCDSPPAFVGAGVLAVIVYVNLLFGLAVCLRHIGKALAVILLVMQIPGSSGMFPVEMMPKFYQIINPLLPFTYSIDAMREAIGGFYGNHYLVDMLILGLAFLPIGFIVGIIGVKFGYNLNMLFDAKLSKTDLFASEKVPNDDRWFRPRKVIKALLTTDVYREQIITRAKGFNKLYPKLTRVGWISIFVIPIVMLTVMVFFDGSPNDKLILLSLFILIIVIDVIYLIVISYVDADIKYQFNRAESSDGDTAPLGKHAAKTGDANE